MDIDNFEELNIEEDFELLNLLAEYHLIFQTFWTVGKPRLTREIPTAAIGFDIEGEASFMIINPDFWDSLNTFNRAFVIAHECLHIILQHGSRGSGYKNYRNVNIAQDIVINEMLVNGFGFNKYDINNWNKFCFVETVFKPENISRFKIAKNGSFEYYLKLIEKTNINKGVETVDSHDVNNSDKEKRRSKSGRAMNAAKKYSEQASDALNDAISDELSQEEIEGLSEIFNEEFKKISERNGLTLGRGYMGFGGYLQFKLGKVANKKKWETIVTSNVKTLYTYGYHDKESWVTRDRRNAFLSPELMMQGTWNEYGRYKGRYNLIFFLDVSGSCLPYAERFFELLRTIPKQKFRINAFSFDVETRSLDLKKGQIVGGGGTRFDILENKVQEIKLKDKVHADLVFVLSDGYGTRYNPEIPERWHWLLTPLNKEVYIHEKSNIHHLKDFI